jgi:hypothetical protein
VHDPSGILSSQAFALEFDSDASIISSNLLLLPKQALGSRLGLDHPSLQSPNFVDDDKTG